MLKIYKCVPHGSILGPYYLTILLTISSFFVNKCDLYNYADDNTLSKSDNTLETVIESLEEDSRSLMSLFAFNKMQAKPDKLQKIAISSKTHKQNIVCDLYGSKINCDDEVKLLGITIDFKLDFNKHISNIC